MRHTRLLATALALAGLTACAQPLERYRDQGIALYNQDQYGESLTVLNKALAHDQSDPEANTYAGLIHYRQGEYEQALYHFKVALQFDPSSERAKNGITATLIKMDRPDLAMDYLERAAALSAKVKDPRASNGDVRRFYLHPVDENLFLGQAGDRARIAKAYELLGDYDNALIYYKRALDLSPNDAPVLLAMAVLFEKTGNRQGARDALAAAYRADPQTPGLTEAMTRNGLAISDVLPVPTVRAPLVPAPTPAPTPAPAPSNAPAQ